MNEEQPTEEQPAQPADAPRDEAQPLEPQVRDPRRRLRELLAVPERDRSDAVWDEIVSLEIQLAPGNRAPSAQGDSGRRQEPGRQQESGRRPDQGRRQEPRSDAKPAKRFFKRPKRG
jgi:hypothetical protein